MNTRNKGKKIFSGIWVTGLLLSSGLHAEKPEWTYPIPNPSTENITRLQVSVNELVLSVTGLAEYGIPELGQVSDSGRSRSITITNTGTVAATDVVYGSSFPLPEGTSISPASCGTIEPSGSCVLTITPGATPSAEVGHTNPKPVVLIIAGSNTNTVSSAIYILTYGSVYQGGFVFAFDDTKGCSSPGECAGSVGGKVVMMRNAGHAQWHKDWNTTDGVPAARSPTDGAANTRAIVAKFPDNSNNYAANVCSKYHVSDASNTYDDWYLPAICEMGYTGHVINGQCGGTDRDPKLQNIQSSLVDAAVVGAPEGDYWSSTEWASAGAYYQWFYPFESRQFSKAKIYNYAIRCTRAF